MNLTAQTERSFIRLKSDLKDLIEVSGFCGLKGGTETEDMDYDELYMLHLLGKDLLPVTVKIGGPGARTDIRYCYSTGIEGICAPM